MLFEVLGGGGGGNGALGAGGGKVEISKVTERSYIVSITTEQGGERVVLASNDVQLTEEQAGELAAGSEVTVEGTNRPDDNPVFATQMTLTFAQDGQVIIADITMLTP